MKMNTDRKRIFLWLVYSLAVISLIIIFIIRSDILTELGVASSGRPVNSETETFDEEERTETAEASAGTDLKQEKPSGNNNAIQETTDANGKADGLEAELKTLEEENQALNQEYKERIKIIDEYRDKATEKNDKNKAILNYYVENFNAQYDTEAVKELEGQNQINYAVGELSKTSLLKYTMPELQFFGLMGSMINANNEDRYRYMVNINNYYESTLESTAKRTRESIEKLGAKIDTFKVLASDGPGREEKIRNARLLEYLSEKGSTINTEDELREVENNLYIYSRQLSLVRDIYKIILLESSDKNEYLSKLGDQISEINGLYNEDEVRARFSGSELGQYLIPIIDYYVWVVRSDSDLGYDTIDLDYRSRSLPGNRYYRYDFRSTNDGYMYLARICECKYNGNAISNPSEDIYYVGGSNPVMINGEYVYDGMCLMDDGSDADSLYSYSNSLENSLF